MAQYSKRILFFILIAVTLLTGFTVTAYLSYSISVNEFEKEVANSSIPLASDNIYAKIKEDLVRPISISSFMANDHFVIKWLEEGEMETPQISSYLMDIKNRFHTFSAFLVSEKTRKYYTPYGNIKQVSKEDPRDKWYFRVREMDVISEMNLDPDFANDDSITIFINYKIFDHDSVFLGATGVGLTVNFVSNLISEYHQRYNKDICLLDTLGISLLPQNDIHDYLAHNETDRAKIKNIILSHSSIDTIITLDGRTTSVYSRFIPEIKTYLIVSQDFDEKEMVHKRVLHKNLIIAVIITCIVLIMIVLLIEKYHEIMKKQEQQIRIRDEELLRNNSKLRANQLRLQKMIETRDKFFVIIGHDLKNPFTAVYGFAKLINERYDSMKREDIHKYIDIIYRNSESTLALLENLLTWAFAQRDGFVCSKDYFYMNNLLSAISESVMPLAEKKEITMQLSVDDKLGVYADKEMIETVIRNLLTNAVKFTPSHGRITLTIVECESDVIISIADTGLGMSEDQINNLFEMRDTMSTEGTNHEKGTGLGLLICHEFLKAHNSEIVVESTLGVGTTFSFSLSKR